MTSVLFVCLGNICRSPMAEAIFRDLLKNYCLDSIVRVDSAGIGNWHVGKPPHDGTCKVLSKYNISFDNIFARQVTIEDLQEFDMIIVMDKKNLRTIEGMTTGGGGNIYLLTDFISNKQEANIQDPFHTGEFEKTFQIINLGCMGLLEDIISKNTRKRQ